jgi:hypothetical protein
MTGAPQRSSAFSARATHASGPGPTRGRPLPAVLTASPLWRLWFGPLAVAFGLARLLLMPAGVPYVSPRWFTGAFVAAAARGPSAAPAARGPHKRRPPREARNAIGTQHRGSSAARHNRGNECFGLASGSALARGLLLRGVHPRACHGAPAMVELPCRPAVAFQSLPLRLPSTPRKQPTRSHHHQPRRLHRGRGGKGGHAGGTATAAAHPTRPSRACERHSRAVPLSSTRQTRRASAASARPPRRRRARPCGARGQTRR